MLAPPLLIEFFGLPGSGKTTIAREVHRMMRRHDPGCLFSPQITLDHWRGPSRSLARLGLIARNPPVRATDLAAAVQVWRIPQRSRRDSLKALFNHLTVTSLYHRLERQGHSAVIDQGVLQAIWSAEIMSGEPFTAASWSALLGSDIGGQRIHICVETPVDCCQSRLGAREGKHSRMQSGNAMTDTGLWERAETIRAGVTEALLHPEQHARHGRLLVVDGTRDPGTLAVEIMEDVLMTPFRAPPKDPVLHPPGECASGC